jgi:hypothetical protein
MHPPLAQPDVVLSEVSRRGLTMAHLEATAAMLSSERSMSDAAVERTVRALLAECGATAPGDAMAMRIALGALHSGA